MSVGHCAFCKLWFDEGAELEFQMHLIAHHDGKDVRIDTVGKGAFQLRIAFAPGAHIALDPVPGKHLMGLYEAVAWEKAHGKP